MTTTPTSSAQDEPARGAPSARSGGPATAGGDVSRLNAFDGLFLRAEHLAEMQDYARDLAYAVGSVGGPGVVHGYDVTVQTDGLRIDAGLAINAGGRPLRSRRVVTLPWSMFVTQPDGWFRIEVGPFDWGFGEAEVQALLCDDPCSGGTRRTLHRAEGVEVHVETDTAKGFDGVAEEARRGWLASHVFAAEETAAGVWPPAGPSRLAERPWRPPSPGAATERVPLALVIPIGDDKMNWLVDVWSVRRDRGSTPPEDFWRWRLAMRPWSVFIAQVLQFQDHYAAAWLPWLKQKPPLTQRDLSARLENLYETLTGRSTVGPRKVVKSILHDLGGGGVPEDLPTLPKVGIAELPAAGLLVVQPPPTKGGLQAAVRDEIHRLLAGGADVRVRQCGAGDVGFAIEQARHRHRIPIGNPDHPTPIDVLLPVENEEWKTDWVAFVRRKEMEQSAQDDGLIEDVDVFVVDDKADGDKFTKDVETAQDGRIPNGAEGPTILRYPANSWAQPQGDQRQLLARLQGLEGSRAVIALVADETRWALGVVRAGLLATGYSAAGTLLPSVATFSGAQRDAIVLVVGPPPELD